MISRSSLGNLRVVSALSAAQQETDMINEENDKWIGVRRGEERITRAILGMCVVAAFVVGGLWFTIVTGENGAPVPAPASVVASVPTSR